jgi:hypothetical protein
MFHKVLEARATPLVNSVGARIGEELIADGY